MTLTDFFLGCIVVIEVCNLVIRMGKIYEPEVPPLDENLRKRLYS